MRRLSFIALVLLLLASCADKNKSNYSPTLTEQEMIAILSDIQILEADLNLRKTNQQDIEGLANSYYGQLFEHYGITDSVFSQNMAYYTQSPALMERIMDSVTLRLTREQTESRRDDSQ